MGKTILPNQFFGRLCWQLLLILLIFADLPNFCFETVTQTTKTPLFHNQLQFSIIHILSLTDFQISLLFLTSQTPAT